MRRIFRKPARVATRLCSPREERPAGRELHGPTSSQNIKLYLHAQLYDISRACSVGRSIPRFARCKSKSRKLTFRCDRPEIQRPHISACFLLHRFTGDAGARTDDAKKKVELTTHDTQILYDVKKKIEWKVAQSDPCPNQHLSTPSTHNSRP